MKISLFVTHNNPAKVEKVELEDVAEWNVNDNGILFKFNDGTDDFISFRSNDGVGEVDWMGLTVVGIRVGLKIDLSK